jgi:hypothetical protein
MKTKYKFIEIFKLKELIDNYNMNNSEEQRIKYKFKNDGFKQGETEYTGYHMWCYEENEDNWYISIIQNFGSYGREKDLLEIMGLLTTEESQNDSVVGYLTFENVFNRIKKFNERE